MEQPSINQHGAHSLMTRIFKRFSLLDDKADNAQIDESLRAGVVLEGATPWILMFAIFIASIGLNVNSAAVIIGAMLISPLMGPIMGIGYGVGIYDFALIRKSLLNLGIATAISLLTACVYFLISPLDEAQSELLARTTPTLWDVLIAIFGGLAGVVGATRREKSNVIPGVAIATALMPPLCTAGSGLADGNWNFASGALYLFLFNSVFIAASTAIIISLLHLPRHKFVDAVTETRVKRALFFVVMLTALPSCYLAYKLVGNEVYNQTARTFVNTAFQFKGSHVVQVGISQKARLIEVTLVGEPISSSSLQTIESKLATSNLRNTRLVVHQGASNTVDMAAIKEGVLGDLYQKSIQEVSARDEQIKQLQAALAQAESDQSMNSDILQELQAQYPQTLRAIAGQGHLASGKAVNSAPALIHVLLTTTRGALSVEDRAKVTRWYQARTKDEHAEVYFETGR